MNIISTLKTLPVIAAVALGLVLLPTYSMADNGDRGRHKGQSSNIAGQLHNKAHNKGHYRADKPKHTKQRNTVHGYDKHKRKYVSKNHHGKSHAHHNSHTHNKYDRHGHRGNHKRKHNYRGHSHTHYVVNDYGHRDGYIDFDDLRFMIGLHTNNFDIIFRD